MAFQVAELSIELIEVLAPLMPRIKQRDRSLADQLSRAASSTALNIGEAQLSDPGNRRARLFSAAGSANETLTGLRVAIAWRHLLAKEAQERVSVGAADCRDTLEDDAGLALRGFEASGSIPGASASAMNANRRQAAACCATPSLSYKPNGERADRPESDIKSLPEPSHPRT